MPPILRRGSKDFYVAESRQGFVKCFLMSPNLGRGFEVIFVIEFRQSFLSFLMSPNFDKSS
jgi:hypothetical protein